MGLWPRGDGALIAVVVTVVTGGGGTAAVVVLGTVAVMVAEPLNGV